jgi:transcriptional regulator GlxA family with amidase domain
MPDIAVLLFDDCQPSAVSTIIEALSIANFHLTLANADGKPPFSWRTISFDGRVVRAMGGVTIAADTSSEKLSRPDLIFVPAIRSDDPVAMDRRIGQLIAQWSDALRDHHKRKGYLAANCSATFVLAEAGLLDGRTATTSWFLSRNFRSRYPRVHLTPEMLVTLDSRIFCAAAFSACSNLSLDIVAEFLGPRAAVAMARVMLVDAKRRAQLPYTELVGQVHHGDDLVLRAQTILLTNLARAPDLEALSDRVHVSSRTLARRFKGALGETPLTSVVPSSSAPASEVTNPPSKAASTWRPSTAPKSNDCALHSVGIGRSSNLRKVVVAQQLSLIRSPDAPICMRNAR